MGRCGIEPKRRASTQLATVDRCRSHISLRSTQCQSARSFLRQIRGAADPAARCENCCRICHGPILIASQHHGRRDRRGGRGSRLDLNPVHSHRQNAAHPGCDANRSRSRIQEFQSLHSVETVQGRHNRRCTRIAGAKVYRVYRRRREPRFRQTRRIRRPVSIATRNVRPALRGRVASPIQIPCRRCQHVQQHFGRIGQIKRVSETTGQYPQRQIRNVGDVVGSADQFVAPRAKTQQPPGVDQPHSSCIYRQRTGSREHNLVGSSQRSQIKSQSASRRPAAQGDVAVGGHIPTCGNAIRIKVKAAIATHTH